MKNVLVSIRVLAYSFILLVSCQLTASQPNSNSKILPAEILFAIVGKKKVNSADILMVKFLLQQGVDPNTRDWNESAFSNAVRNNNQAVVQTLLGGGADPNETRAGFCPLEEVLNTLRANLNARIFVRL